ncbi:MAG: hypothetical protein IJ587_04115, partial [Synergistaceae bacterium]|nr:hypothetical protein [Synergistaceae bacterium]
SVGAGLGVAATVANETGEQQEANPEESYPEEEYSEDEYYDEYYEEDRELYESPRFNAIMEEAMAEAEDIIAHPENYKFYDSVKEMLRDKGFDVSGISDD